MKKKKTIVVYVISLSSFLSMLRPYLQVHDSSIVGRCLEGGQQPRLHLRLQRLHDKFLKRLGAKLVTSQLPLRPPLVAVDVENTAAKKVTQDFSERLPFREIKEMGRQNILHVNRVHRHHRTPAAEAVDDDSAGGGFRQELSVPIQEAVAVNVEGEETADERVRRRGRVGRKVAGGWSESEEEDNENRNGEERDDDTHEMVII